MAHTSQSPARHGARQQSSTHVQDAANTLTPADAQAGIASATYARAAALAEILPKGTPPELIAAIEDASRRAFERHGAAAFEMSREAAIAHEAGHTIVATHEGLIIQSVRVFSRSVPIFGKVWGGWCAEEDGIEWTTGPDTNAESDLSRARVFIAGLAGEASVGLDKPGSSLDEEALSQLIGINAAVKLGDSKLSDAEHEVFARRLWDEQVWRGALAILDANRGPFMRVVEHLHRHEIIRGGKLRAVLARVRRLP